MRILMFGMSSYPGGIENYIVNFFCHEHLPEDVRVDFVTYETTIAYSDKLLRQGHSVIHVPHLKRSPVGYFKAIGKLLRDKQYDCVYVNMLTAANIIPVWVSVRARIKNIVIHAHANSTVKGMVRRTLHHLNRRYCSKKATLRLACSKQAGDWLFGDDPFYVIPNAIDCSRFKYDANIRTQIRKELNISEDTFVLGHVGRLAPEKNHLYMLEILKELRKTRQAVLLLVGDGGLKQQIQERAKALNIDKHVVFCGTTDQTHKFYSSFDCFLFPSTFEGFGIAALEAQASGLPCFCSDCLSPELNVSGTVQYISLACEPERWCSFINKGIFTEEQRQEQNVRVSVSPYNITNQISVLTELLYGQAKIPSVDCHGGTT